MKEKLKEALERIGRVIINSCIIYAVSCIVVGTSYRYTIPIEIDPWI